MKDVVKIPSAYLFLCAVCIFAFALGGFTKDIKKQLIIFLPVCLHCLFVRDYKSHNAIISSFF